MTNITGFPLLILAVIAYKSGRWISAKVYILDHYHIPAPVVGGLVFSILFALANYLFGFQPVWDFELRDTLLLIFFSTVGLNVRFRLLLSGGSTLVVLLFIIFVFLLLQNGFGIMSALLLGEPPINGLLAGTVSLAGGHGTAISWGTFLETQGYAQASGFGLVSATMGLIAGGLLGGPVAHRLITHHRLTPGSVDESFVIPEDYETRKIKLCMQEILKVVLLISVSIVCGKSLHGYLSEHGMVMPTYLPILLVSIVFINLVDLTRWTFSEQFINLFGDICLELFITMSLISLNLLQLMNTAVPALVIVLLQCVVICLFAYFIMFRAAGKDYDASLISAGFVGVGLGATPVGLANVNALSRRFGPSPKAFLVVPILGSVFTDTLNAIVLQGFLSLPLFQ